MTAPNIFQIVLSIVGVLLIAFLLANRGKAKTSALAKILFVLACIGGVYAIFRPDDLTTVAGWVGVGRGADLLLYLLAIAFTFTTIGTYMRFRESEIRYARLARAVALQNAAAGIGSGPPERPGQHERG